MSQGWISLHRKIMEHPFYLEKRKFSKFEAWIDLLLLANHKDSKVMLGNEMIYVEKGSFITSELKLMERWGWSKTKVRNFLDLLEKDNMIVKKTDRKKTTISIVNYCVYQDSETTKKPQKDHEETTRRPQKDTNNNDNNENNENNNIKSRKRTQRIYEDDSDEMKLVDFFISEIRKNDPKFKEPNKQKWADEFRKLIELDERDKKEIARLIRWVQQDDFEKANVLSPTKLRKRYASLLMKMNKPLKKFSYTRQEAVPDWFYQRNQQQISEHEENNAIDFEAERQKILAKLNSSDG